MKEQLKQRNAQKTKKPTFIRSDSNKYKFNNKWRRPRGSHNKVKLRRKGHQKRPEIGYGSPNLVKYLTKDGYKRVNVSNLNDLISFDKESEIVILSSKVGLKKKIQILNEVIEKGFKIENVKNPKKYVEEQKLNLDKNKKLKQEKLKQKEKSKTESLKKKEEKKETGEEKQEEIKEEVLSVEPEIKQKLVAEVKKDNIQSKTGHKASNVPGARQ